MFGDNSSTIDDGDKLGKLIASSYYELQRIANNTNSKTHPIINNNPHSQSQQNTTGKFAYLNQSPLHDRVNVSMSSPSPEQSSPPSSANKYYRFIPIQSTPLYFASQWQVNSVVDDDVQNHDKKQAQIICQRDGDGGQFMRQNGRIGGEGGQCLLLSQVNGCVADGLFDKTEQLLKQNIIEACKSRQRPGFIKQQRNRTVQSQLQASQQHQQKQTANSYFYKPHNYQQPTSSSSQSTTTTPTIHPSSHFTIPPSPHSPSSYIKPQPPLTLTFTNHDDDDNTICDIDDNDDVIGKGNGLLRRQYEQDLFEFIKQQLIRVSVQNKGILQVEGDGEQELAVVKDINRQLYAAYKQATTNLTSTKQYQHTSISSLQQQVQILQQQLTLSQTQRAKISTSITQKMHKQDQLYFKHKTNLQNVILTNNQTLAYLSGLVESARRRWEEQQVLCVGKGEQKREEKLTVGKDVRSLSMMEEQNAYLKKQLVHQQQLFNNTFSKFLAMDSALNHLKLKKQSQLNQLYQQLQYAKHLASRLP